VGSEDVYKRQLDTLFRDKKEGNFSRLWGIKTNRYTVIEVEGIYFEWDHQEHRPLSYGMTKHEMIKYVNHWFWPIEGRVLQDALESENSVVLAIEGSVEYVRDVVIPKNCLGPDGSSLTVDELIYIYSVKPKEAVKRLNHER
jgi:hypothetical protein